MKIVVFGGTGTLGHALAKILNREKAEVTIVSRDELKQKKMRCLYPHFKFVIGDISGDAWKNNVTSNPDYVFNLAAMKHVEVAEDNVEQCMLTNYQGTVNTYKHFQSNMPYYIFSSTDKAVLPINAYGYSKGAAEKYLYNMSQGMGKPVVFRWGNIIGSRGSVIHAFKDSLEREGKIYITDRRMTRFWANIDDVAHFMWRHRDSITKEEPHIPGMKAAPVEQIGDAVANYLGISNYDIEEIGIRPGEKLHECLRTGHDYCITSNNCEQYTYDDLLDIVARSLQ